jgi:hypothetical protein
MVVADLQDCSARPTAWTAELSDLGGPAEPR